MLRGAPGRLGKLQVTFESNAGIELVNRVAKGYE